MADPQPAGSSRADQTASEPIHLAGPEAPLTTEQPGRYDVRREFGRGGQAVVYLVRDGHIGRDVALKQMLPHRQTAEDDRGEVRTTAAAQRFIREARITGQLEHPGIVPVYELGERADGSFYYVQKLVRGRTLRTALDGCKTVSDRLGLLSHFVDICQALAYAHRRGVVHRDIKPENVMVGEFGETVILDWGLAKVKHHEDVRPDQPQIAQKGDEDPFATKAGAVLGTPLYMSPEQASGKLDQIDERTDVWALGALLYEILAGRPPFLGKNATAVLLKVLNETPQPVRAHCPEAPAELASVAERCLQRERSARYATAKELAAEIHAWQSGARVAAYEYSSWELLKKFVAKNRVASGVAAAALVLLIGASVLIWRAHGEAVGYLADALQGKARDAAQRLNWGVAQAYWAASRAQEDRLESRWGQGLARGAALRPQRRLIGHAGIVHTAIYSPDGKLALSGAGDQALVIWDTQSWTALARLEGHDRAIFGIAVAPDGKLALTADRGGTIRFWSLATRAPLEHRSGYRTGQATGDNLFGALGALAVSKAGLNAVAFTHDGRAAVVADDDGVLRFIDVQARKVTREIAAHTKRVRAIAFAPDGTLWSAGEDGFIRSFAPDGKPGASLEVRGTKLRAIAVSPDGKTVAAGGSTGTLRLFHLGKAEPLHLDGHERVVSAVSFSPDGRTLASASWDSTIAIWDATSGRPLARAAAADQSVLAIAFSPRGDQLLTAHHQQSLRVWGLPEKPLVSFSGHGGAVRGLAFTKDGAGLLAASHDGRLSRWDLATHKRTTLVEADDAGRAVAVSSDGALALLAGDSKEIAIVPLAGGPLRGIRAPPGIVSISLSTDGKLLATAGPVGAVAVWEVATGVVISRPKVDRGRANSVSLSADGTLLAVASDDAVLLFDPRTGAAKGELQGKETRLRAVAFSRDGKWIVTGGNDGTIRLWDAVARRSRWTKRGHEGPARAVAFSPDGNVVATGGADRAVRIWTIASGELVLQSSRHEGEVMSIAYSPDGALLASAGADKVIELLPVGHIRSLPPPAQSLREVQQSQWLELVRLDAKERVPGKVGEIDKLAPPDANDAD